jgi:hypothetical protein
VDTFKSCRLYIYNDGMAQMRHCLTEFNDKTTSSAWPPWGEPEHVMASWHCGYGGDQWAMMREHEIAHHYLADVMGLPHSYSVWSHAHGTGEPGKQFSQRVADEEHLVTSFQRWINTGQWDEYNQLANIPNRYIVARDYIAMARPHLAFLKGMAAEVAE